MKKKKYVIAAFDFDGTITKKDTFIDFLVFAFGLRKFLKGIFKFSPMLSLYKIGVLPNYYVKERLFMYFFKEYNIGKFNKLCESYSSRINQILNVQIIEKIHWHKRRGDKVVIISASIENWIQPWANKNHIDYVIGTVPEVKNEKLTGKFFTKNCYGIEKINRLLKIFPNRDDFLLYAYGDSKGDKELLAFADKSFKITKNCIENKTNTCTL